MQPVKLKRLLATARIPTKGTKGSAYSDLYSAESSFIPAGEVKAISTGWLIEVPHGYFLDIRSRSGLSLKGIIISNSPGTVDEDFRGELKMLVLNSTKNHYQVNIGDRMAQCALMPVVPTDFIEVDKLSKTERGTGGYGSTGV
jgi:dUTP pyrophosphatase